MQRKVRSLSNKKGDMFTPEVLHMVLAVLCLIFLVYLGVSMYSILTNKQEVQQAKSLQEDILLLETDVFSGLQKTYLVVGPRSWFIKDANVGEKLECKQNACLCVCDADDCKGDYSICRETKFKGIIFVEKGTTATFIDLKNVPVQLTLSKQGDYLKLEHG